MANKALAGKILRWGGLPPNEGLFSVSLFVEPLGKGYWLMQRLCPRHGESLGVKHVIHLKQLLREESADIYETWDDLPTGDDDEDETSHPGIRRVSLN